MGMETVIFCINLNHGKGITGTAVLQSKHDLFVCHLMEISSFV